MNASKTAWLFPGQGSQAVGMGRTLCKEFPPADRLLDLASEIAKQPLKRYCWQGPDEVLTQTDILQPALTAITLGCIMLLQEAGHRPDSVAGHSLGEFAALYAAGVLSPEDTLRLVVERGKLMHRVSQAAAGGMIAVKGLGVSQVEQIAASLPTGSQVAVANYNAPDQVVLSGGADDLREAGKRIVALGGTAVPLNVSGPWHSAVLQDAAEAFAAILDSVSFRSPHTVIYLNATGAVEFDPERMSCLAARQLVSPVRWCPIIQSMIADGTRLFLEVGPGKVLRGLLRRIWPDINAYTTRGIDCRRSLEYLAQEPVREARADYVYPAA